MCRLNQVMSIITLPAVEVKGCSVMTLYVCLYVCLLACMFACMYVCLYVYLLVCMFAYMYVCLYVSGYLNNTCNYELHWFPVHFSTRLSLEG